MQKELSIPCEILSSALLARSAQAFGLILYSFCLPKYISQNLGNSETKMPNNSKQFQIGCPINPNELGYVYFFFFRKIWPF